MVVPNRGSTAASAARSSFRGRHHHLTCVTVAHAFLTCGRLARGDPDHARPDTAAA